MPTITQTSGVVEKKSIHTITIPVSGLTHSLAALNCLANSNFSILQQYEKDAQLEVIKDLFTRYQIHLNRFGYLDDAGLFHFHPGDTPPSEAVDLVYVLHSDLSAKDEVIGNLARKIIEFSQCLAGEF